MSHITEIQLKILDLRALKAACRDHGLSFNENDTAYKCWTQFLVDQGMSEAECRRCAASQGVDWDARQHSAHSISLDGVYGQIGVFKDPTGPGYTLGFDPWTPNADKTSFTEKLGGGLAKLRQSYAVCKAELEARARGWMVERQMLKSGSVKLILSGVGV